MTTNIVVLGGSFNPFGKHHLRVLQELDARDQFDLILVVPSAAHPLKMFDEGTALSHSDLIPVEHRIAMARLGLIESGIRTHVALFVLEKQLAQRSGGPVYTWDLLCDLRKRCDQGDAQLNIRFAIGPDIRSELHRWKYVSASLKGTCEQKTLHLGVPSSRRHGRHRALHNHEARAVRRPADQTT